MDLDLLFLRQDARHVASLTSPSKGASLWCRHSNKMHVASEGLGNVLLKEHLRWRNLTCVLSFHRGEEINSGKFQKSAILQYRAVYNPTRIKFMKDIIFPRRNKVCKKKQQCLSQISFSKKEKFPTCAASCFKSLSKRPRLVCLFSIFVLRL